MEEYKILFVDDDSAILSIVDKYLSREGYKVWLAESGAEALKLLKDKKFDIVFTDFKMPGIVGKKHYDIGNDLYRKMLDR